MEEHKCRASLYRHMCLGQHPCAAQSCCKGNTICSMRTGSQGTVLSVRQPGEAHTNPWMRDIRARMARTVCAVFGRACMQIQGDLIMLMVLFSVSLSLSFSPLETLNLSYLYLHVHVSWMK